MREKLNDKNETLVCTICKEPFHKDEGKFLIKNEQIICPYCLEEGNGNLESGSLLLG